MVNGDQIYSGIGIAVTVICVATNAATLVGTLYNISKEIRPSIFQMIHSVVGSTTDAASPPKTPARPSNHPAAVTNTSTVIQNRMIIAGIALSTAGSADPAGFRGLISFNVWYAIFVAQMWMAYGLLAFYFFSWLLFLMDLQEIDINFAKKFRLFGFLTAFIINSLFTVFFMRGLIVPEPVFCNASYISFIGFWLASHVLFALTAAVFAWRTIKLLQKSSFKRQNDADIKKIRRKTFLFVLVNKTGAFSLVIAFAIQVWLDVCERHDPPKWFFLNLQAVSSAGWLFILFFNWIWGDKRFSSEDRNLGKVVSMQLPATAASGTASAPENTSAPFPESGRNASVADLSSQ